MSADIDKTNPFDLDSTHRYDWDEEPETCLFRPGYFQISIPSSVRELWRPRRNADCARGSQQNTFL